MLSANRSGYLEETVQLGNPDVRSGENHGSVSGQLLETLIRHGGRMGAYMEVLAACLEQLPRQDAIITMRRRHRW